MYVITDNGVVTTADDIDTIKCVEGNQVPGTGFRTADQVAAGIVLDFNAVVGIVTAIERTCDVGADIITLNRVVVGIDFDAFIIHRNNVARICVRAADSRVICAG